MSRCFPYPPPHYKQSQIESIKLLKGIEKSKKNEEEENKTQKKRQWEMAKHKPLKSDPEHGSHEYRTNEEKNHKKRKYEKKSPTVQQQYSQKSRKDVTEQLERSGRKDVTEQLERSGLTEEHERPFSSQNKLDSPESSHDSSKRRKVVSCVSIHETHGTVLRIKLPSSNHKLSVQPPSASQKQMESDVLSLSRPTKPELLLSMRQIKREKPLPSLTRTKSEHPLALSKQVKLQPPIPLSKQVKSEPPLPSSKQVKLAPPLLSSKQVRSELPLPSLMQANSDHPLPSSKQEKSELLLPLVEQRRNSQTLFEHSIKLTVNKHPAFDEQACSSGRGVEATVGQEASLARHRASSSKRISRKDRKNQQIEDLTVNWKALTLQVDCSDTNDEWLLKAPKREIRSGIEGRASGEGLTCKINDTSSRQPRACYLPELDTYQLPYVVPY